MAAKDNVILRGAGIFFADDKITSPGTTTLTAAAVIGAGTLTVAAITNFAVNDWIRVGTGNGVELVQLHASTAPAGNTITLSALTPIRLPHAIGEAVVEQTIYDAGSALQSDPPKVSWKGDATSLYVHDSRLPHVVLPGYVEMDAEFSFPNVSLYSLMWGVGGLTTLVKGAETASSPRQMITDGTDFAGASNRSLIICGKTFAGADKILVLCGIDADYTGISFKLSRGKETPIKAKFIAAAGGYALDTLPTFNADVSLKPTKAKCFDSLVQASWGSDAALAATTVSAGAVAGTSSFTAALGTGLAIGDPIKFGTGNLAEVFRLDTINTGTGVGTIRGIFYRNHNGDAFKKQTINDFVGVDADGATFGFGGTFEIMKSALSRIAIGARPGQFEANVGIPVIDTALTILALALGIPQSAVSGGSLSINGLNMLTAVDLNFVYLRGVLVDATNFELWGISPSIDPTQPTDMVFNNAGKPNTTELTCKPSAQIQLLNW